MKKLLALALLLAFAARCPAQCPDNLPPPPSCPGQPQPDATPRIDPLSALGSFIESVQAQLNSTKMGLDIEPLYVAGVRWRFAGASLFAEDQRDIGNLLDASEMSLKACKSQYESAYQACVVARLAHQQALDIVSAGGDATAATGAAQLRASEAAAVAGNAAASLVIADLMARAASNRLTDLGF